MSTISDLVKALKELSEVIGAVGRGAVTEADAYKAQIKRVFNLPEEKIDLMTSKWSDRGKPYAERVKVAKEIYHDWKKRHEAADPAHKLEVWYAVLKAAIGIRLTDRERYVLVRYGLDREIRERIGGLR